jgi:hypothetical protein
MAWKSISQQISDDDYKRELEADESNREFKIVPSKMEKFICAFGHIWEEDIGNIINTVNEEQDDPEFLTSETDLMEICTEADIECPECGTCYFVPLKVLQKDPFSDGLNYHYSEEEES